MKANVIKSVLLFLFILLLLKPNYCQTYHHFNTNGKHWRVESSSDIGEHSYYHYILNGDTSFNGITYNKCYDFPEAPVIHLNYRGAIMEDTIGKKVYIRWDLADFNQLLYDFSLNAGDTVSQDAYCYLGSDGDIYKVETVDSVMINGKYVKRWIIISGNYGNILNYVYEGLGSVLGLFEPWTQLEVHSILNCVSVIDETIFPDSSITCPMIGPNGIKEQINTCKISINPNPVIFKSIISYFSENDIIISFELNNLLGFTIYSNHQIDNNKILICKNDYPSGIYYYRIITKNNKSFYGKLIII